MARPPLNGNPNPIGQVVHLSDETFTVIGVLPADFTFPPCTRCRRLHHPRTRLRRQESLVRAARLEPASAPSPASPPASPSPRPAPKCRPSRSTLAHQYPDDDGRETATSVTPELQDLTGDLQQPLHLLFAAVALLLLIACANVAGLLLTRSAARPPRSSPSAPLSAPPVPRSSASSFSNPLTLSTLGGLGGLLLAVTALHLAPTLLPNDLPRLNELSLNPHLFLFALAASLLTGLLFGVIPAWRASLLDPAIALRDSTRSTSAGRSQNRLHAALVIGETDLGLVLLIAAGLFLRSFSRLLSTDPGFNPQHLITFRVGMPPKRFQHAQLLQLTQQLQTRFSALPGVRQSTFAFPFPLTGGDMQVTFKIAGRPTPPSEEPAARVGAIPSNFFQTMGIPLLRGRTFTPAEDQPASPPTAVVVNQAFARHFFPGGDALGQHLIPDISALDTPETREIVGVVGDTSHTSLGEDPQPEYFLPFAQITPGPPTFALRVAGDPAAYNNTVRTLVASIDPTLPVYAVRTDLLARSTAQQRFQTTLLSAFAGLALLLSALGLYAVLSYMVSQRTLELGLRLALGAGRSDVLTLVLRRGLLLSAAGLALGLIISLALTRYLGALLFHTPALDPLTLIATTALSSPSPPPPAPFPPGEPPASTLTTSSTSNNQKPQRTRAL